MMRAWARARVSTSVDAVIYGGQEAVSRLLVDLFENLRCPRPPKANLEQDEARETKVSRAKSYATGRSS